MELFIAMTKPDPGSINASGGSNFSSQLQLSTTSIECLDGIAEHTQITAEIEAR